jgi:ArsR family transcriptional regulator
MSRREIDDCASRLRVLADETRLNVLLQLQDVPKHVGELNAAIDVPQNLLSHHLRVLRDAGLVEAERDGRAVVYRLAPGVKTRSRARELDLGCCLLSFE